MWRLFALLLAAITASTANATSVNLRWVDAETSDSSPVEGLGTSSLTISAGAVATVTLDVEIDVDAAGLSSAFLSLEFDRDLLNELDVSSVEELGWTSEDGSRSLIPLTAGIDSMQESTSSQIGKLYTFDGATLENGPESTTFAFARIVFTTNPGAVASDGPDIFAGIFNCPDTCIDGLFSNALEDNDITSSVTFGTAQLNVVPEPSSLGLLALGLGALARAAAARRPPGLRRGRRHVE
jgi:hypothetical protein